MCVDAFVWTLSCVDVCEFVFLCFVFCGMQVEGKTLIADEFKDVTILFTDLRGFTDFASRIQPKDLVLFLNVMYTQVARCVVECC